MLYLLISVLWAGIDPAILETGLSWLWRLFTAIVGLYNGYSSSCGNDGFFEPFASLTVVTIVSYVTADLFR